MGFCSLLALASAFCLVYDVSPEGNWEHQNILNRTASLDERCKELKVDRHWLEDTIAVAQRKLLTVRNERIPPLRDEKVLVSWNGLMIEAMALGGTLLHDERYTAAADKAARFILEKMKRDEAGLLLFHSYKDGSARFNAFLDDYANLLNGTLALFEATGDPFWLKTSVALAETILDQFWDVKENAFFFTPKNHEALITRPREMHDGATPSATAMAVTGLARLGLITGKTRYLQRSEAVLNVLSKQMETIPTAFGQCLQTVELLFGDAMEWVLFTGDKAEDNEQVETAIRAKFSPNKVTVVVKKESASELAKLSELLDDKKTLNHEPTLYVCRKASCQAPLVGVQAIEAFLKNE